MKKHNLENITNKIINVADYTYNKNPPSLYKLKSKVISYFDGIQRNIIALPIALSYPIIYINYYQESGNMVELTLAVCPYTLVAVILKGKFTATEYIDKLCIVITNGTLTFPLIDAYKYDAHTNFDVDIKLLRNIFSEYPNCSYLSTELPITQLIEDSNYYTNTDIYFNFSNLNDQIHPKTLVYVIFYKSSKDQTDKISILVGKDANANFVSGFDSAISGFTKYYIKYESDMHKKFAYIMPMFWFASNIFFPNSRIIFLE